MIYKAFNLGTHVDLTERIIYNALVANSYQNFDGDFIPINVPMINPDAMTDYQERIYRLKVMALLMICQRDLLGLSKNRIGS